MKKYFAKYLPVEGEIKEGDVTKGSSGAFYDITKIHVATNKKGLTNYKLFKLFLCNRDIQVGDKAYGIIHTGEYKEHNLLTCEDAVKLAKTEGDFKVIGEISPDAVWVKEGDEFNQDDFIIQCRYCMLSGETNLHHKLGCEKKSKESLIVKIKCSQCKTYH